MTDEQRSRIAIPKSGDCTFDGMPVHPHYYWYLTRAGFKEISDIEELTEEEFTLRIAETLDKILKKHISPATITKNIKKKGIIFKE